MTKYLIACLIGLTTLYAEQTEEVAVVKPSISIAREILQPIGMPVVSLWHSMKENLFLNYAQEDATGLEAMGNWVLSPYRYLMGGSKYIIQNQCVSSFPSFDYQKHDGMKTILSIVSLPISTLIGAALKGISYLFSSSTYHYLQAWKQSRPFISYNSRYLDQGIESLFSSEQAPCLHLSRPSKLSKIRQRELKALKELTTLLDKHQIVYWLDCGSALGAYRYQGMIPWDDDIDISIIADDHQNVKKLLEGLNPKKYQIQDWSSNHYPQTFLKLYLKKTKTLIDIYHYTLDPHQKTATYCYTYKDTPLPRQWKRMEEAMTSPIPYSVLFPLKRTTFDGIDVWAAHDLETFLHSKYGTHLSPTMLWDEKHQCYLKVKDHPYWQLFE